MALPEKPEPAAGKATGSEVVDQRGGRVDSENSPRHVGPQGAQLLDWPRARWLLDQSVTVETLIAVGPLGLAVGRVAHDGRFDVDHDGESFIVFATGDDSVFWQPRTGALATWHGRTFALGEATIDNPAVCFLDGALRIFVDPLQWLRAGCAGIVVIDWAGAWWRLHHLPAVAVDERVLPQFRRHMRPPRGPEVRILATPREVAAA